MMRLTVLCLAALLSITMGANLNKTCYSDDYCDVPNSVCRPHGCEGYVCQCKVGYTKRDELCEEVSLQTGPCSNSSDCLDESWTCSSGTCGCSPGSFPSPNFNCYPSFMTTGMLGEPCSSADECLFPLNCTNSQCSCPDGTFPWTEEQKWLAYPSLGPLQCRFGNNSYDFCNGTEVPRPGANLNKTCYSDDYCDVPNSVCRPHGCEGYVCQCKVGYTKRDELCEEVSLQTGPCSNSSDCLDESWTCSSGTCGCSPGSFPSPNFNCYPSFMTTGMLGEPCSSADECLFPLNCTNSQCSCPDGTFPWTEEQKWLAYPSLGPLQCRFGNNSYDFCNGTEVPRPGANLNKTCYSDDYCDVPNSVCRPHGCEGYVCQCKVGYTKRDELCEEVSLQTGPCSNSSDCLDESWTCSSGTCGCSPGSFPSPNFNCYPSFMTTGMLGEPCSSADECLFPLNCTNSQCSCPDGTFPWTEEQKWLAYPSLGPLQCRFGNNSYDFCNGTEVPRPGANLNKTCYSDDYCDVPNSVCRPHGCEGYVCQCKVGYTKRDELCEEVSLQTGPCSNSSDCLDESWTCSSGTCGCSPGSFPSPNFNCYPSFMTTGMLGEPCSSADECLFPLNCTNSQCSCPDGTFPWTEEQKWLAYPSLGPLQCRFGNNSYDFCNGTEVPRPVLPETTSSYETTTPVVVGSTTMMESTTTSLEITSATPTTSSSETTEIETTTTVTTTAVETTSPGSQDTRTEQATSGQATLSVSQTTTSKVDMSTAEPRDPTKTSADITIQSEEITRADTTVFSTSKFATSSVPWDTTTIFFMETTTMDNNDEPYTTTPIPPAIPVFQTSTETVKPTTREATSSKRNTEEASLYPTTPQGVSTSEDATTKIQPTPTSTSSDTFSTPEEFSSTAASPSVAPTSSETISTSINVVPPSSSTVLPSVSASVSISDSVTTPSATPTPEAPPTFVSVTTPESETESSSVTLQSTSPSIASTPSISPSVSTSDSVTTPSATPTPEAPPTSVSVTTPESETESSSITLQSTSPSIASTPSISPSVSISYSVTTPSVTSTPEAPPTSAPVTSSESETESSTLSTPEAVTDPSETPVTNETAVTVPSTNDPGIGGDQRIRNFPIEEIAIPSAIGFILLIVIIFIVCLLIRRSRQKKQNLIDDSSSSSYDRYSIKIPRPKTWDTATYGNSRTWHSSLPDYPEMYPYVFFNSSYVNEKLS